jgi:hypothetical protein
MEENAPKWDKPDECSCCGKPLAYVLGHAILACLDCANHPLGVPCPNKNVTPEKRINPLGYE